MLPMVASQALQQLNANGMNTQGMNSQGMNLQGMNQAMDPMGQQGLNNNPSLTNANGQLLLTNGQ